MTTKTLFNHYWQFKKTSLATKVSDLFKELEGFSEVTLPHDWLIYDVEHLYEDAIGWYIKQLTIEDGEVDQYLLRFEGVYMDATIYVNGQIAGEWKYGYSTFEIDMTDLLRPGDNQLLVRVVHQSPNSRWYSGAGIYRDVWLIQRSKNHLVSDGIYVHIDKRTSWHIGVDVELAVEDHGTLTCEIHDDGTMIARSSEAVARKATQVSINMTADNVKLWSPDKPYLYRLICRLAIGDHLVEEAEISIGFRQVAMNPSTGFCLNGKSMKLNGVCEHHDLGALGAAYNSEAMRLRLMKLKAMGVNALRTAHNMPAPNLMDLCDELGLLVISEGFDMWSLSKTTYDYARFFEAWASRDVANWIRRDRNHPSLLMWSIGNEIYDTHIDDRGQGITKELSGLVRLHDPKENGAITIGSNYMPWDKAQKCGDIVKFVGYNYGEKYYEDHHKTYPDWVIYGSETGSVVQSRGIYHFPRKSSILADDDCQCSSLGNSITSWGAKSTSLCASYDKSLPYSLGQFIWTGFDYIGEPTPYHTKNAYYGQLDTCGFEKDSYYIYKAAWTDPEQEVVLHLYPYWDFNDGQLIDVVAASNAHELTLFVNDLALATQMVPHDGPEAFTVSWRLPFVKGQIRAIALDQDGELVAERIRKTPGEASAIQGNVSKATMVADGKDLIKLDLYAVDGHGNEVENANNHLKVELSGPGVILGIDNGDSTDFSAYKGPSKSLFSGKATCYIGSTLSHGYISVNVTSKGLKPYTQRLASEAHDLIGEAGKWNEEVAYVRSGAIADDPLESKAPVLTRRIDLQSSDGFQLSPQKQEVTIQATLLPSASSAQAMTWRLVNNSGIDAPYAKIIPGKNACIVRGISDGECKIRCMVNNGKDHADIMSEMSLKVTGFGQAYKDPYDFITGGLYDEAYGDVGNGNERGVATSRDGGSVVVYKNIDFGSYGSDRLHLPIFALDDGQHTIEVWEGDPMKGGLLIDKLFYQLPSQWNVYQAKDYHLSRRLSGVKTIAFATEEKIHLKGFYFERLNKADQVLMASECDKIYGDAYQLEEWGYSAIGNNVSITFEDMDFKGKGAVGIEVAGKANHRANTIILEIMTDLGTYKEMLTFPVTSSLAEQRYKLGHVKGKGRVTFIFLPGSDFDFHCFNFLSM